MQKTEAKHRSWLLATLFAALVAVASPVFASDRRMDSGIILGGALGAAAGMVLASAQWPMLIHRQHVHSHWDNDHDLRHERSQAKHH